jgi:hypothetical protein
LGFGTKTSRGFTPKNPAKTRQSEHPYCILLQRRSGLFQCDYGHPQGGCITIFVDKVNAELVLERIK